MRRKHRILVEVTFDKRVTAKTAKNVIHEALNSVEFETYDLGPGEPRVLRHETKEAERVLQAELRWRGNRLRESTRSSGDVG